MDYQAYRESRLLPEIESSKVLYNEMTQSINLDKSIKEREQKEALRKYNEGYTNMSNYYISEKQALQERSQFLDNCKTGFVSSALTKVISESMVNPMTSDDISMLRSIVTEFVNEQGAGNLLNRFKHQNVYLAELGKACRNAYVSTVNSINENSPNMDIQPTEDFKGQKQNDMSIYDKIKPMGQLLKLDSHIIDDFYKDVDGSINQGVTQVIRDKVLDAMTEFVERNRENKLLVQDIIDRTKNKLASLPEPHVNDSSIDDNMSMNTTVGTENNNMPQENAIARDIRSRANLEISQIRQNTSRSPFHYMVENITKEILNNNDLKSKFITEGKLDMDRVVHNAEILYTMLETFNTLEVVDKDYIRKYIESLVA